MTTFAIGLLITFTLVLNPIGTNAAPLEKLSKKVSAAIYVDEGEKVGILPFPYHDGKISSGSSILSERLTTELVQDGVRVVERSLIQKVLEEKKFEQSGFIEEQSVKGLGTLLGIDVLLVGTLIDLQKDKTELNARLIDMQSGEIRFAKKLKVKRTWRDRPKSIKKKQNKALTQFDEIMEDERRPYNDVVLTHVPKPARRTLSGKIVNNAKGRGDVPHLSNRDFPPDNYTEREKRRRARNQRVLARSEKEGTILNEVFAAFDAILDDPRPPRRRNRLRSRW